MHKKLPLDKFRQKFIIKFIMTNEQEQLDQNIKESWFSRIGVQKPYTVFVCIVAIIILGVFAFSSMQVDLFPSMNMPYAMVVVNPNTSYLTKYMQDNFSDKMIDLAISDAKGVDGYDLTRLSDDEAALREALKKPQAELKDVLTNEANKGNQVVISYMPLMQAMMTDADGKLLNPAAAQALQQRVLFACLPTRAQMETLTDTILSSLSRVSGINRTQSVTMLSSGLVMITLEYNSDATVDRADLLMAMDAVGLDNAVAYGLQFDKTIMQIDPSLLPIMSVTVSYAGKDDDWFNKNVVSKIHTTVGVGSVSTNIASSDTDTNRDQAWESNKGSLVETYSLSIQKNSNAVTTDVAANVIKTLEKIKQDNLSADGQVQFDYHVTSSQAEYINESIGSVGENLIIGGLLALVILFLFLRSVRMTLAIGISIPLALVGTFVIMYFMGIGLNIISMSGLALAVGMLVDNSVVVLENIYRLRSKGLPIKAACIKGASQIMLAMLASSLTTICVFFPMFFLEGMIMEVFTDLVWVVILSLLCSFVVAVMFLPAIVATFKIDAKKPKAVAANQKPTWWQRFTAGANRVFDQTLRFCINKKWLTVTLALVLFVGSACLLLVNGFIILPATDAGNFTITATLDSAGIAVADSNKKTVLAEPLYNAIAELLGDDFDQCVVSYNSGTGAMAMFTGTGEAIEVEVQLKDQRKLSTAEAADKVYKALLDYQKRTTDKDGNPYYADMEVASSSMTQGLVASDVSVSLTIGEEDSAVAGKVLDDFGVALTAKFDDALRDELKIKSIIFEQNAGQKIVKYNNKFTMDFTIKAFADADTNKIQSKLDALVDELLHSDEFKDQDLAILDSGLAQQMNDTYTSMGIALIVGFLLIYLVMVAIFQSFLMPFIILICVPLGFTGAFLLLAMCGMPLSMPALIGFLILMGVVINNGILAVDYTNQARRDGLSVKEALVAAMHTRMRPIFMTALTTVLAMVPMAFGWSIFNTSSSAALMQPLAVVSIGGLLFGTVTTLLVVPAFYAIFCHDKKNKTTPATVQGDLVPTTATPVTETVAAPIDTTPVDQAGTTHGDTPKPKTKKMVNSKKTNLTTK